MKRRQVLRAQAVKSQTGSSARRFVSSGPVLPFNPASIPGCQLWLDAADTSSILVDSSSNVSLWIDKSSYENNFSLTSGTTSKINDGGYSVINFPSGATMSSAKQITFTTSSAFFIVSKLTSLSASTISMVVGFTNMYDGDYTFVRYNPSTILNGTAATTTNERDVGNNNYYVNGTFNPSTFGSNYYLNTYSIIGTVSPTTSGTSYLTLSSAFSSRYFIGNIAEFLYYPTGLTTIQRQKVEGYLANKWGLKTSLPSNHPYKSASPTYEEPIFVPTLILGNQLWLDGADPAGTGTPPANGATVSTLIDKATGNNASATGTPTYLTGGGVNFNGSSYFLNQTFSQNISQRSVFIVFQETSRTQYAGVFPLIPTLPEQFDQSQTSGLSYSTTDNSLQVYGNNSYGLYIGNANPLPKAIYNEIMNIREGSGYLNGTNTTNVTATYTAGTCSGYGLACRWQEGSVFGSLRLNGVIYEIIVFNTPLITSQRKRVEGYLAQKWGLHSFLPANHPYKSIAPTGIPRSIMIQSLSALYNNSSITVPSKSSVTLGINNHTIEFWLYQTSRGQYDCPFQYSTNTSAFSTNSYYMAIGGYIGILIGNDSGGFTINMGSTVSLPSLNAWHHYAIVRTGTTFTLYIDGISRETATSSVNIGAQAGSFIIGDVSTSTNTPIFGYITNFRVVNGTAVYTSNFTPPTSPLTAIPNTQLLIQGLADRSPNAFTVTNNRGVTLSTSVSPFV